MTCSSATQALQRTTAINHATLSWLATCSRPIQGLHRAVCSREVLKVGAQRAGVSGLPSWERSAVGHGWQAEGAHQAHVRRLIVQAEHVKQLAAAETVLMSEHPLGC